jgi:hypothetical protein
MLLHESGESIELMGYGHGVDTQDKGAGKATTYALKNCLLYTFLTPVGKIDDTETTHSEEIATPKKNGQIANIPPKTKDKMEMNDKVFGTYLERIKAGESGLIEKIKEAFIVGENKMDALQKAEDRRKKLEKELSNA